VSVGYLRGLAVIFGTREIILPLTVRLSETRENTRMSVDTDISERCEKCFYWQQVLKF
jgi:hypothetical protein